MALLRWPAAGAALLLLLGTAAQVGAHSADMYVQSQAVGLSPEGLTIDWKIAPGPILSSEEGWLCWLRSRGRAAGCRDQIRSGNLELLAPIRKLGKVHLAS